MQTLKLINTLHVQIKHKHIYVAQKARVYA
jgi:hypothetical protein